MTMTTDTTLFDEGWDRPQIVMNDDTARARKSDPAQSHRAADRSQASKQHVADAVLLLVRQEESLSGSEANELYRLRATRNGWPIVAWDSPRKRLAELFADGILVCLNADDPRGTERVFALPADGKKEAA